MVTLLSDKIKRGIGLIYRVRPNWTPIRRRAAPLARGDGLMELEHRRGAAAPALRGRVESLKERGRGPLRRLDCGGGRRFVCDPCSKYAQAGRRRRD